MRFFPISLCIWWNLHNFAILLHKYYTSNLYFLTIYFKKPFFTFLKKKKNKRTCQHDWRKDTFFKASHIPFQHETCYLSSAIEAWHGFRAFNGMAYCKTGHVCEVSTNVKSTVVNSLFPCWGMRNHFQVSLYSWQRLVFLQCSMCGFAN